VILGAALEIAVDGEVLGQPAVGCVRWRRGADDGRMMLLHGRLQGKHGRALMLVLLQRRHQYRVLILLLLKGHHGCVLMLMLMLERMQMLMLLLMMMLLLLLLLKPEHIRMLQRQHVGELLLLLKRRHEIVWLIHRR
jgi:hypothetical protein